MWLTATTKVTCPCTQPTTSHTQQQHHQERARLFCCGAREKKSVTSRQDLSCETSRPLHTKTDSRVVHVPSQVLRVHDVVRATVGFPGDDRDLRHRGLGVGKQQLQRSRGSDVREGKNRAREWVSAKYFNVQHDVTVRQGPRSMHGSRLEKNTAHRDATRNAQRAS